MHGRKQKVKRNRFGDGKEKSCQYMVDAVSKLFYGIPINGYVAFNMETTGTIALALEKDPLLTNLEIKMMLRESTEDMGLPRNQQGWGKFNCQKFLAL